MKKVKIGNLYFLNTFFKVSTNWGSVSIVEGLKR
jgi:hypothetical protein